MCPPDLSHSSRRSSANKIPQHIAVVMDGNGRWAQRRYMPRFFGHQAGIETVKTTVRICNEKHIKFLTLFAFSSENRRRPQKEIGILMDLFTVALREQDQKLHENNIRLRIIGDHDVLNSDLSHQIEASETLTQDNTGLTLIIAMHYGGRWDLTQACRSIAQRAVAGKLDTAAIDEQLVHQSLCLGDLPDPDLFIRTGGEKRISNFLLWNLAYTELYFTDVLWPDFDQQTLDNALETYAARQRRFGRISEQTTNAPEG